MKRNRLLIIFLALSLLAAAFASQAALAKTYKVKFSISVAPTEPAARAAERFAKNVEAASNGQLQVTVYPSEQLGGEPDVVQGVRLGAIQMAFLSPGVLGNLDPEFGILNGPFLWPSWAVATKVLTGPFAEGLYGRFLQKTGIRVLDALWYWGWRDMTANKPIRTPADLRGLKMRSPNIPLFVEMFKALGANPTPINFQEIYSALQQGVVDGQENPIPAIWSQKFYEVNKYVSLTKHILQSNIIVMNDRFFQSLPDDLQALIHTEIVKAGQYNTQLQQEAENSLMQKMKDSGVVIVEDVDRDAFQEQTQSLYDKFASKWGPELYPSLQEAIHDAMK